MMGRLPEMAAPVPEHRGTAHLLAGGSVRSPAEHCQDSEPDHTLADRRDLRSCKRPARADREDGSNQDRQVGRTENQTAVEFDPEVADGVWKMPKQARKD